MSWTIETLKEYIDKVFFEHEIRYSQRFESQEKSVASALAAAKEAVTKAENAAEKRFESVNEFRNTLSDQQRTLMPRPEAELLIKGLSDRLTKLETVNTETQGQGQGKEALWGWIVGISGFITGLVGVLWAILKK